MEASVTSLIARLRDGDQSALNQLMPMVYSELHKIATGYLKNESHPQTLQPTALVHEAYIRLLGADHPDYANRAHFYAVAANLMRQILVDHARARQAAKRGGGALSLVIDERRDDAPARAPTIVALDDALKALARTDENKVRLVELRFFGGMTAEEIAEFLPDSVRRVRRETRLAIAWLHREVTR